MSVEPGEPQVSALNLKLPPFWPSDAEVWFAQVEAQFGTRGITAQKTKFDHIVASLVPEYAFEVRDIILHPPESRPYDRLREILVQRTGTSSRRRLQQLLTSEELGDRKPSQLLRKMQQLLGSRMTDTDDALVRELFLQRLPANVRAVLASSPDSTPLDELARFADRIIDAAPPSIAGISAPALQEVEQLRAEVSRLTNLASSLTQSRRRSPTPHRRSPTPRRRHRSPTPRRPSSPEHRALCWYHQRFGDVARNCRAPCSMSENDQAGR